ncbi:hypothetical protein ELI43_06820 [Rhizobium leguminosarum]|uniref:hypothetical protein n=1 Tax=Rhizobium leguminosarum TaxID=384 RepID=UPI001032066C|nr:hypothetical protein [Rhizobium leguminosarum]TAU52542.1 hypothetical protein ELI43_06820 [Rhizobium leguminosarum]
MENGNASLLRRVDEGTWWDHSGRLAHHSVFQVEQFFDSNQPLLKTDVSHIHNFAIISEGASETAAIATAEVLYLTGLLKPVAYIIVQADCIAFVVSLASFYMNKRQKWGRWKQGVHSACRSTGYSKTIDCIAFDQSGSLHIGRNCEVRSRFRASHMVSLDQRWKLYAPS